MIGDCRDGRPSPEGVPQVASGKQSHGGKPPFWRNRLLEKQLRPFTREVVHTELAKQSHGGHWTAISGLGRFTIRPTKAATGVRRFLRTARTASSLLGGTHSSRPPLVWASVRRVRRKSW